MTTYTKRRQRQRQNQSRKNIKKRQSQRQSQSLKKYNIKKKYKGGFKELIEYLYKPLGESIVVPMTDTIDKEYTEDFYQKINTKLNELFHSFYDEHINNNNQEIYNFTKDNKDEIDKYIFNLYEILGIPDLSYILDNNAIKTNLPKHVASFFNSPGNFFTQRRTGFDSKKPNFYFLQYNFGAKIQSWNIFLFANSYDRYNAGSSYPIPPKISYIPNVDSTIVKQFGYKIHFMPDYKYIVYTVLKILKILNDKFNDCKFELKFNLNNRISQGLTKTDSFMDLNINGGPSPSIVLYSSEYSDLTLQLLKVLVESFKEEEYIGTMTESNENQDFQLKVPIYNVRINNLICYAHGDRGYKLDTQLEDLKKSSKKLPYKIPIWLHNMKSECNEETKDAINKESYNYVGEPVCDIELNDDCIKNPNCYLTLKPNRMVNPSDIQ